MLTIHYRPLDALRPLHVALLVALESRPDVPEAAAALGLPHRELECAAAELEAWAFLARVRGALQTTERGERCVRAWKDTKGQRVWSLAKHSEWVLGAGCFYFSRPLASLEEAGWDVEKGERLSEEDALERIQKEHALTRVRKKGMGAPAREELLRQRLAEGEDWEEAWEDFFAGVQSSQELKKLEQQVRGVMAGLLLREGAGQSAPFGASRAGEEEVDESLARFLKQTRWQLWQRQQDLHAAREVLLAAWLGRQRGLVGRLARGEPGLVKVVCEGTEAGDGRDAWFSGECRAA
jgi:hypothetical protein